MWAPAIVVALALITGGVAATQGVASESERVGICHETSTGDPVYIVVDRNGADHAHHAQHEHDEINVSSEAECEAAFTSTTGEAHTEGCHEGLETQTDTANAGAQAQTPNATQNESTTEHEETVEDPDVVGLCDADVAVNQTADTNGTWVRFTTLTQNVGTGEANDVLLDAWLPDVGRAWRFVGQPPAGCLLEARHVSCEFGDLAPGASRAVIVKAARCAEDCGDDLEANASVAAYNDGDAANNDAESILIVEDCPRGTPLSTSTPTSPTQDPQSTQPATNTTDPQPDGPENGTSADNESQPQDPAQNGTDRPEPRDNASANASAPRRDASIGQRADQTEDQVVLTLIVRSLGDAAAQNVSLHDTLPDVRRTWHLSGADGESCTLDGRWLNCWFGDLGPGEQRQVVLKAYTDRMACGQHLTNNATIGSDGDANPLNNRSGASIEARGC